MLPTPSKSADQMQAEWKLDHLFSRYGLHSGVALQSQWLAEHKAVYTLWNCKAMEENMIV